MQDISNKKQIFLLSYTPLYMFTLTPFQNDAFWWKIPFHKKKVPVHTSVFVAFSLSTLKC